MQCDIKCSKGDMFSDHFYRDSFQREKMYCVKTRSLLRG